MPRQCFLGIDCGSVSLNIVVLGSSSKDPFSLYRRTNGRPLETFVSAVGDLVRRFGDQARMEGVLVTGSGRELFARCLDIPTVNEISAHAAGAYRADPRIRTIIEIGGQDSKFIRIEPPGQGSSPQIVSFRMNEICAAGTGAFLDEQADRLGIPLESFESLALTSREPAPIAGRCAVFAKTDMIHQAQEGRPLPDILMGVAYALARNYMATLIRGDALVPLVSLQGGVMANRAVVEAFLELLGVAEDEIIISQHHKVLGALGCAIMAEASSSRREIGLEDLWHRAMNAQQPASSRFILAPLEHSGPYFSCTNEIVRNEITGRPPYIMGLDVGSVSVKGVVIDAQGAIVAEDYRLSSGRPFHALEHVITALSRRVPHVVACSVTGSGRVLAGRLLRANLTVNEITAQARAATAHDSRVDTIIEIGGQDSKWISLESTTLKDFEMNRVCAAGTGSFLMEQAERLGFDVGDEFVEAAFSSSAPSDLGTRCTVFMESDLIHHQNNGSSRKDLAAGVCVSIVRNYLERVAGHKPMGRRILFLGGVAANAAVRSAFERETGRSLESPEFFRVSGAFGAALKALDSVEAGNLVPQERSLNTVSLKGIEKRCFSCSGCPNQCRIDEYRLEDRRVFHGGRCDRWEVEARSRHADSGPDLFRARTDLLQGGAEAVGEAVSDRKTTGADVHTWGMIRSPHYYEWYPFWKEFWGVLGISLVVAPAPDRKQFESGTRHLRVETCLPMKVMAGQARALTERGVTTIFHPAILNEPPVTLGGRPVEHCPYIQASAQFYRGSFDVEWLEPVISHEVAVDAFRTEHLLLAHRLGFADAHVAEAFESGMAKQAEFEGKIEQLGREFLESVREGEQAIVVLGKPYHTAEPFLNMNLGSLFSRLGIKAIPGDLVPLERHPARNPIAWKNQLRMIAVARAIAQDQRLFPVMITSFGCGPDPFTVRHIRESLKGKPLLVLEMDEHTSRAGVMTRLEAFLDRIKSGALRRGAVDEESVPGIRPRSRSRVSPRAASSEEARTDPIRIDAMNVSPHSAGTGDSTSFPRRGRGEPSGERLVRGRRVDRIYLPHFGDHARAFAAAACSVGIEAHVLPPPNEESERLGRPHLVGGECHPYALILGDYLRLAESLAIDKGNRSIFCVPGYSACRLGQYPVYMEKVRKECGHSMRVIADLSQALTAFGLSKKNREHVLLRTWEGLNAYDVLLQVYLKVRPVASSPERVEQLYEKCRDSLFQSLCRGEAVTGLEDALQAFYGVPVREEAGRPAVAVTGDYYTRIVSYANNEVFRELESLGGTVWSPPTFSDGLKLYYLQEVLGRHSILSSSSDFASRCSFYASVVLSELQIKGSALARRTLGGRLDPFGLRMTRKVARHMDPRYPPGMSAPLATALNQIEQGADGVLNLITLNCSYGTVVTAALSRALRDRPGFPLLTLVYDGLKKTNEKTRLEAFMEQVHHRHRALGEA